MRSSAKTLDTDRAIGGSFRDPSGIVFYGKDGVLYRQINRVYGPIYRQLVDSGLWYELVDAGLLVNHEEVNLDLCLNDDACAVIRPEPIPFVSYPYEWCFGQLRDAALLTLDIQKRAIAKNMGLKDASAFNVQFIGPTPVFIDTLSFELYPEGRPWIAYRQFCRHFLAPLAAMSFVDPRMNDLLRVHLDGVPLDAASRLLPWRSYLRLGLAVHIHLHRRMERRTSPEQYDPDAMKPVARDGVLAIIDNLESTIKGLPAPVDVRTWTDYYETCSYSAEHAAAKERFVQAALEHFRPNTVWDLGANVGLYSRLAAATGAYVVALDQDHACVEAMYHEAAYGILPLRMDLANPSPRLGWAHVERDSLEDRGPADAALALALTHHLCLGNNVPLNAAARWFHAISRRLIVEFVPKDDPQARTLLAAKSDIFPEYTRAGFESAFAEHFTIEEVLPLGDPARVLYRMTARPLRDAKIP